MEREQTECHSHRILQQSIGLAGMTSPHAPVHAVFEWTWGRYGVGWRNFTTCIFRLLEPLHGMVVRPNTAGLPRCGLTCKSLAGGTCRLVGVKYRAPTTATRL